MNITVRIEEAEGNYRIIRARDKRPLFGDRRFPDPAAARFWLDEANSKSEVNRWLEEKKGRKNTSRFEQLPLFA